MFVAALLDAFPEHWPAVEAAVAGLDLGPDVACRLVPHRDGAALTGRRFLVGAEDRGHAHHGDDHRDHGYDPRYGHRHGEGHRHHEDGGHRQSHGEGRRPHDHRAWSSIRALIEASRLGASVKREALAIFSGLAEAEGAVHGVPPEEVAFHEVGAVDSIVDVVAAAQIIALVGACHWSAAPLPLGSGRVKTAHGVLPVPAPATALLLRAETTTIGLRFHTVQGAALPRGFDTVAVEGRDLRTKSVTRPDGSRTAKTESADVAAEPGHVARTRLRRDAEALALIRLAARTGDPS